jgi:hypothetical protein
MSPLLMRGTLPAPAVEKMLLAPESETVEPVVLMAAAPVSEPAKPGILARVAGWLASVRSEAA